MQFSQAYLRLNITVEIKSFNRKRKIEHYYYQN